MPGSLERQVSRLVLLEAQRAWSVARQLARQASRPRWALQQQALEQPQAASAQP